MNYFCYVATIDSIWNQSLITVYTDSYYRLMLHLIGIQMFPAMLLPWGEAHTLELLVLNVCRVSSSTLLFKLYINEFYMYNYVCMKQPRWYYSLIVATENWKLVTAFVFIIMISITIFGDRCGVYGNNSPAINQINWTQHISCRKHGTWKLGMLQ